MLYGTQESFIEVANEIEYGDELKIKYHSSRSDDKQEVTGSVTKLLLHNENKRITIKRDDGQLMTVHGSDGELKSHGSHFPRTGYAYDYEII